MSRSCHNIREKFHSYRLGELSSLGQQRVAIHLENCPTCKSELWLQSRLEDTAKGGTVPLSDLKKRQILNNINQQISTEPAPLLGGTLLEKLLRPALALPAAAAVAFVVYFAFSNQQSPPEFAPALLPSAAAPTQSPAPTISPETPTKIAPRKAGWLNAGAGIRAFATNQSRIETNSTATSSSIRLDFGEVIASFKRPKGGHPLRIETPHATAIIRGTAFSISSSSAETRVVVRNGKVEVRARSGNTVMVHGGEMVLVTTDGINHGSAPKPRIEAITLQLNPMAQKSAPSVKKASPKQSSGRNLLMRARKFWRNGYPLRALTLIEELLASESNPHLLEEGHYLKATIYRDQGQRRAAAQTLELLAKNSKSETGRLAQLERARILSNQLNQYELAAKTLESLLNDNQRDVVAEEASFELCAIYLESDKLPKAKQCLSKFILNFPRSSHIGEASLVLQELQ